MINGTPITITGNLGDDPEMRYTATGQAVTSFSIGVTEKKKNRQTGKWENGDTTWYRVISWGFLAENIAESFQRGTRAIVLGTIRNRQWENREGEKRYTLEITADSIGADLTYATVKITRTTRESAPIDDHAPWESEPAGEPASEPAF
jgi:single-strand DNA-binding protein